jgi:pimeloyl-ACP methyl ester carboxylesterase
VIALLPSWSIVHSRFWKGQIAYLARHVPVIVFDGRGNGRSDRPRALGAYAVGEFADDALAVFDATDTRSAVLVSLSMGATWSLLLAATHPERVRGAIFIGPALRLVETGDRGGGDDDFDVERETYQGWEKYNRHYWRRDYADFLRFFFAECLPEPHSTKQHEDCVTWGLHTDAETLLLTEDAPGLGGPERIAALARSVRCPVLVLHGDDDRIIPHAQGAALAELSGGRLVTFEGSGHLLQAREPVRVNLAIRAFVDGLREADR